MTRTAAKAGAIRAQGADVRRRRRARQDGGHARRRGRRARRRRPPDDRPRRRHRHAQNRQVVRAHEPVAHRGHRHAPRRRASGGRPAPRRPELRGLALRAGRRPGQDRGRSARYRSAAEDAAGSSRGYAMSRTWSPPPTASRAWSCATAGSTDQAPASTTAPPSTATSNAAAFRSSAPAAAIWSFIHIEDAAEATLAAIEHGAPGIYNIVDDDPAPVSEWLPELAGDRRRGAAAPSARARRSPGGGQARGGDDDQDPRGVEREGEARARLGAAARELAAGLPGGVRAASRWPRPLKPPRTARPPPRGPR